MNANMKVSEQCEIAACNDSQVSVTIKNIITYECERLVVSCNSISILIER